MRLHEREIMSIYDEETRLRRLVELNVIEQVHILSKTSIIQNAMLTENPPKLYRQVYDIEEGLLRDLKVNADSFKRYEHIYNTVQQVSEEANTQA